MRVHKTLLTALLVVCMSCSADDELIVSDPSLSYISFSPMYSAFDGTHDYAVTPNLPSAIPSSRNADPILVSSVKWEIDGAFVKRQDFPDLPAAIKLTTKKAGVTSVAVMAKTVGGHAIRSDTQLTIREANLAEFDAGEERYNNGGLHAQELRCCGVCPLLIELPDSSACATCHRADSELASELTPAQTAGYSHDDLINIFTRGAKPAGDVFTSPFLRAVPMPQCIYESFHNWELTDEEKNGLVWKLRSIPPKVSESHRRMMPTR